MNFNQINLYHAQHSKFKEGEFILIFIPHPVYVFPLSFRTAAHYLLFLNPPLNYNREFNYKLF